MKRKMFVPVALLGTAVLSTSLWVQAQSSAADVGTFPYQGHLERDGEPVDGTVPLAFELYDSETGGAPLWTESLPSVRVRQGTFSVVLGDTNQLPESLFDESALYLAISVDGAELAGRQRILPVPVSLRSARVNEIRSDTNMCVVVRLGDACPQGFASAGRTDFAHAHPLPQHSHTIRIDGANTSGSTTNACTLDIDDNAIPEANPNVDCTSYSGGGTARTMTAGSADTSDGAGVPWTVCCNY